MIIFSKLLIVTVIFGTALLYTFIKALKHLLIKAGVIEHSGKEKHFVWVTAHASAVGVTVCGLASIAWSAVEPYYPTVTQTAIHSEKISTPMRIVQISDLHCDPQVRSEEKLVKLVEELKPDLIMFTGDGVNSDDGTPLFKKTMRQLSKIAPVYGVRGNWEIWWFNDPDTFADTGIIELNGTNKSVNIKGNKLSIAGTAVDNEHYMDDALFDMPQDSFRIVLHHYPAAQELIGDRAELLLSGDTHGGQIVLPVIGQLVDIARWDKKFYPLGMTKRGKMWHYVSRGVGMEGGHAPRVRFNCSPEIVSIDLLPPKR